MRFSWALCYDGMRKETSNEESGGTGTRGQRPLASVARVSDLSQVIPKREEKRNDPALSPSWMEGPTSVWVPQRSLRDEHSRKESGRGAVMLRQKMRLEARGSVRAIDLLGQGDRTACEYCHYRVAKQVAASLGAMDENVKAVYVLDYDATPEDLCLGYRQPGDSASTCSSGRDARRPHSSALVEALDRALGRTWPRRSACRRPATCWTCR